MDRDGRVMLANPVASYHLLTLTGAGEGDLIGSIEGRDWQEFILSGEGERFHEVRRETDKGERVFEIGGRYIGEPGEGRGAVFLIRDVTDEKRQEERMQAQERLAAIGQLAAGIAHDFNNLLTVIIGYAEIMMRDPQFPPVYREKIDAIYNGGTRASKLVKQILDFSRKSISQKKPFDLAEFVREFGRFMERTIPENITFEVKVPDGEYVINGDSTKIQQVLANLVVNAKDAILGGGRITLELGSITIQEPLSLSRAELPPGRYAVVTVSDTGTGIPEEIISYIFEPFFTTKGVGKGTGLGLSQVYGIVKQHGGEVDVSSRPGEGTRFDVYLPLVEVEAESQKRDPVKEALPEGGGEKILVVEDDETVRDLIKTLLETMGYTVKEAPNGLEGLRIFESEGKFDLIITDMIMPEVGGMELVREIRKKDPSVKVVVLSGYPDLEDEEMILAGGVDRVIGKPINIKPFAKAIHELLGKKD
ncbi:MAG: response regulator [Nitrospirae bacterium]|nr:MAG: response regulator [Nitrospirota bacterium]